MKKILLIALSFCFTAISMAQIHNLINPDADFIFSVNASQVKGKINNEQIKTLPLYEEVLKDGNKKHNIFLLALDQDKVGVRTDESWLFSISAPKKGVAVFQTLIPYNDLEKVLEFVGGNEKREVSPEGINYSVGGRGFDLCVWNEKYLALYEVNVSYRYLRESIPNYYDMPWEEKRVLKDSLKTVAVTDCIKLMNNNTPHASVEKLKAVTNDAFMWTSESWLHNKAVIREFDRDFRDFASNISSYPYEEALVSLDFNDNDIVAKSVVKVNDDYKKEVRRANKACVRKSVKKYTNKEAYVNVGFSMNTLRSIELLDKFFEENSVGVPYFKEGYELVRTALDEKAIAKVWSGEIAFSYFGDTLKEQTYLTYDYNYETGEEKQVEKTRKNNVPEFMLAFSTKDKSSAQNIINLLQGELSLVYQDGYYKFYDGRNVFYMMLKDDVFLFTNKTELVTTYKDGFTKKDQFKFSKKAGVVGEVNLSTLLPSFEEIRGREETSLVKMGSVHTESVQFLGTRVKGTNLTTTIKINLKSNENSALTTCFEMMNTFYKGYESYSSSWRSQKYKRSNNDSAENAVEATTEEGVDYAVDAVAEEIVEEAADAVEQAAEEAAYEIEAIEEKVGQ